MSRSSARPARIDRASELRLRQCIGLASELTKGHSTRAKKHLAPELAEEIPFGMGWKNSVVPPICTPLFLNISIFHSRVFKNSFQKFRLQLLKFQKSKLQTETNILVSFMYSFWGGVRVLVVGDHPMRVLEDYDF